MRNILTLSKTCDVDAKFAKEASSSFRKSKMQMQCRLSSKALCFLIHQICDNVLRKNIGYEFLRIQRKRLEILKGQNFTLELRNLLFEGIARVAGF
ncbi:hypothetical protein D8Q48_07185 [Ruminococcus sp. B05]|nr:hypothetical protein D8Q48_07185 [Ruminococcus sp. B05]